jgi:hypothetical protein
MNIAKRTVPLDGLGHRLEFDYNAGLYRMAYYFPERDAISDKQIGEQRIAASRPKLLDALTVVLGEGDAPHDPLTVEHYMRSQPWGRELPK